MKDKKNLIILIACLLVIAGLFLPIILNRRNSVVISDAVKFKNEYEALNNDSVVVELYENNPIKYVNYDELMDKLTNGTSVVYFGFPNCPWCRNMIQVLFDAAADNGVNEIYYFNPQELRNAKDEDYNKLISLLNDYLLEDEDGTKVLYVPDVYFIKDGKIVGHHLSTVDSQTDPYVALTAIQREELMEIYQNLFDKQK